MNDRYLFKAKRDNGVWVQGYYWTNGVGNHFIKICQGEDGRFTLEDFEIDPSTLCQCTDLKDKNKNLIWENDLVSTPREDGYSLIRWNDTEARWEMYNETELIDLNFDDYWGYEIEVVGNQLDNSELLEVE